MEVQDFVYLVAICFVLMLFMSSLSTGRRRRRRRRSSAFAPSVTADANQETSAEVADVPAGDAAAAQPESIPGSTEAPPSSAGDDGDTTIPSSN